MYSGEDCAGCVHLTVYTQPGTGEQKTGMERKIPYMTAIYSAGQILLNHHHATQM